MIKETRVAIIGGGIVGCSIAYHLTKMGWNDVLIIEKGKLTAGSTWHAAGLVHQMRDSLNGSIMHRHSVKLYKELEKETGQATDWYGPGSIRLACTRERAMEHERAVTMAESFGLKASILTPKEAQDLFPLMSLDRVESAMFIEGDGYGDPSSLTHALIKGARNRGAKTLTHTRVLGMTTKNNKITVIETDKGSVKAEIVVNAAGGWAREIGAMVGISIPICFFEHQYMVTENIKGIPDGLPNLRDPDHLLYYKQEVKRLVAGGFERNPIPWSHGGIPKHFGQQLLNGNFEQFEPIMEALMMRTPGMRDVGVRKLVNGPLPVSPDGHFILGPTPGLRNFFQACGLSYGIGSGGGVGWIIAEWIINGRPSLDMGSEDIRRFGDVHLSDKYLHDRSTEMFGKYYVIHWPNDEHESARRIRRSSLYQILKDQGAVYGQKYGWERVNWFAPEGVKPVNIPTWGKPNSFLHVAEDHKAVRERVGIFDQSSFGKIEVKGPGSLEFLQLLSTANLDTPTGIVTYTVWCNEDGGIEADLTIARLGKDHFYVVTGTGFVTFNKEWMNRYMPDDGSVIILDVTSSRSVLGVMGPKSRQLLQQISGDDFSNEGFPFKHVKNVYLGYAPVRASRMTFVGELGWELHIPTEFTVYVYELLQEAGKKFLVKNAGYLAIDSLRIEKRNLLWGSDMTPEFNPFEAGLGFVVSKKKDKFIGKCALDKVREEGVKQKLCCFTMEEELQFFGSETIRCDGKIVGRVTTGAFGYTVGKSIALGYLPIGYAEKENFEIKVFNKKYHATRHDKVLYDSARKCMLA